MERTEAIQNEAWLETIRAKVAYLEKLTQEAVADLALRRAIREEWLSWHEDWKAAWIFSEDDTLRLATSIRIRKNSFPNL